MKPQMPAMMNDKIASRNTPAEVPQGHRLFQSRVGQARFERQPTVEKPLENAVGRHG